MKRTPLQRKTPMRSASLRVSDGKARATVAVLRPRRCKACKVQFTPARPMQHACSPVCALDLAKLVREAEQRKLDKAQRERLKPRSKWMDEAQAAVNAYVRVRDLHLGCVSCDRPSTWGGQWHASHYRSVGAASAVRFHLWNIHKACSICNNHLSGNLAGYRPRLIERIGADRVEWIEAQNQLVRHDVEYLKRLKRVFARKARRLQRKRA
jgi:hypothetical protein